MAARIGEARSARVAACPPLAARPVSAPDSGLRLLVSGAGASRLRWSTDSDAPAARTLRGGELRLAILCFELGAEDVRRCRSGPAPVAEGGWREVPVFGVGRVIESRFDGVAVGALLWGPMRIGTHRVIAADSADADAVVGATDAGAGRWLRRHLALPAFTAGHGEPVERRFIELRDRPHAEVGSRLFGLWTGHSSPGRTLPMIAAPCPS